MAKLPKFEVRYDKKAEHWGLYGSSGKITARDAKDDFLKGGVLAGLVKNNGSVRIKKQDGTVQSERTYPRNADPKKSKG